MRGISMCSFEKTLFKLELFGAPGGWSWFGGRSSAMLPNDVIKHLLRVAKG